MKNWFIARAWIVAGGVAVVTGVPAAVSRADEPCPVGQFRGEYSKEGKRVFAKCEPRINFDWGKSGPRTDPGSGDSKTDSVGSLAVGVDDFSVVWTGRFNFNGGNYTFTVIADDGVQLRVDGQLLLDEWRIQPATEFHATKTLTAGVHLVEVKYFEAKEEAVIKVRWERTGP